MYDTIMHKRLLKYYHNPDQIRLEQILGATTLTIGRFRDKQTGYPFSLVLSRGHILRSEKFRRTVIDDMGVLANDVQMAIGIQGYEYEHDVVAAFERDEYLAEKGWNIRYIPVSWLSEPNRVRSFVNKFI